MKAARPTPRHILFATDLSARCDRARARAISLAKTWDARLTAAHVLDILEMPSDQASRPTLAGAARRAERFLRDDFLDVVGVDVGFDIAEGRPGEAIPEMATRKGCDLIVTGIAGNDTIGRYLLGSTVTTIARHAPMPVLVVKKRVEGAYRRIVVASDLSLASRAALDMALRLFSIDQLTLFHATDIPFSTWIDNPEKYRTEYERNAAAQIKAFLAEADGGESASSIRIVTARGDAAPCLADYVATEMIDLVIAGTHGRSGLMSALIGSVAEAILDEAPCDVMVVPGKGASAT